VAPPVVAIDESAEIAPAPARRRRALALLVAVWLGGACGTAVPGAPEEAPCDNFARVGPGLYRGAEPGEPCLRHLAGRGVRTVVNLRDEKDASDREQAAVLALGMRYVNVPMSGFASPSERDVHHVLALIRASANEPVFVHCKHGRDRTGVVVAAYRVLDQGWGAERALSEAKEFGMAWWQFGMKGFIRNCCDLAEAVVK